MEDIKKNSCWTSRGKDYNVWGEKYLDGINSRLDTAGKTMSVLESIVIETVKNDTEKIITFLKRAKNQWVVEQLKVD